MKRILCIVLACIMATVFMSASDVSAFNPDNVANSEYKINGTLTRYTSAGEYNGTALGEGIIRFGPRVDGTISGSISYGNISADLLYALSYDVYEYYCISGVDPYTVNLSKNKIKSTDCTLICYDPTGATFLTFESPTNGTCVTKFIFSTNRNFTGTTTITLLDGSRMVFNLKGKKLGKYPTILLSPGPSTTLRDRLRDAIPDTFRDMLKK